MACCSTDRVHITVLCVWACVLFTAMVIGEFSSPRDCDEYSLYRDRNCAWSENATATFSDSCGSGGYTISAKVFFMMALTCAVAIPCMSFGLCCCSNWGHDVLCMMDYLMACVWVLLLLVWALGAAVMNEPMCEGSSYTLANDGWRYGPGFITCVTCWCLHTVVLVASLLILIFPNATNPVSAIIAFCRERRDRHLAHQRSQQQRAAAVPQVTPAQPVAPIQQPATSQPQLQSPPPVAVITHALAPQPAPYGYPASPPPPYAPPGQTPPTLCSACSHGGQTHAALPCGHFIGVMMCGPCCQQQLSRGQITCNRCIFLV